MERQMTKLTREEFLAKLEEAVELYRTWLEPGDEQFDTTWEAASAATQVGLEAGPQTNWSARNSATAEAVMLMAEGAEDIYVKNAQDAAFEEFYS